MLNFSFYISIKDSTSWPVRSPFSFGNNNFKDLLASVYGRSLPETRFFPASTFFKRFHASFSSGSVLFLDWFIDSIFIAESIQLTVAIARSKMAHTYIYCHKSLWEMFKQRERWGWGAAAGIKTFRRSTVDRCIIYCESARCDLYPRSPLLSVLLSHGCCFSRKDFGDWSRESCKSCVRQQERDTLGKKIKQYASSVWTRK